MSLLQIHEPGKATGEGTPEEKEVPVAIGIDLGTTNSVVAIPADDDHVQILLDGAGEALLPSVVAYGEDGSVLVGQQAQRQLLIAPDNVITSVKRLMGRGLRDVKDLQGVLPYDLTEELRAALAQMAKEGKAPPTGMIKLDVAGRVVSPVEISAEILKVLKQRAEAALGKTVTHVVITVPAYFDDAARTATKDAARLAGLEVLRLVNEPTAAALAYGLDQEDANPPNGTYVVYDLGGGTFDVSVLKLQKGVFQVLATGGDAALGGDDFDHKIAEFFLEQHPQAEQKSGDVKQLLATARHAKEALSQQDLCEVAFGDDVENVTYTITQDQFNDLTKPLLDRTLALCAHTLQEADVVLKDVNGVILVGGATRIPAVRRAVEQFFDQPPLAGIDPDKVVSVGAARQAAALTQGSDTLLLDVLPLSLGLETMGGLTEKIIPRNAPIPVSKTQEFTTFQDGQTAMLIHVVQGEREAVSDNRSLAQFTLRKIPALTAGTARIAVTFNVDADGILTVTAREQTTGTAAHVEVKPSYGLDESELQAMLMAALDHGEEDMQQRLLIEQRVDARRFLQALATALVEDGDLLERQAREDIDVLRQKLEHCIDGDDRDAMQKIMKDLENKTQEFAEARVNRALQQNLAGKRVEAL